MTLVLVSAPVATPVDLPALKLHCRVDSADEDELITALQAAAVGHLDGWEGVLGRAIMEQTWSIEASAAGQILLPMPDVITATTDYGDGVVSLTMTPCVSGTLVEVDQACTVEFTCKMTDAKRAIAVLIIKMLVQHWYTNRGAVSAGNITSEIPMSANALIESLRWRRV